MTINESTEKILQALRHVYTKVDDLLFEMINISHEIREELKKAVPAPGGNQAPAAKEEAAPGGAPEEVPAPAKEKPEPKQEEIF